MLNNGLKVLTFAGALTTIFLAHAQDTAIDPRAEGMDMAVVQKTAELFKGVMVSRHGTPEKRTAYLGSLKAMRAVFLKTHGCAKGKFIVPADLPEEFKVGVFKSASERPVYVRISSDNEPTSPEKDLNTVGIALKVVGVEGDKVLPKEKTAKTQDFLLQNHHVFFVDNALDFSRIFTHPEEIEKETLDRYNKILDVDMKKKVGNVFKTTYWSTTPYKFGPEHFAKYKIVACDTNKGDTTDSTRPNFLAERMARDLRAGSNCLKLQVQLQKPGMPLDQATKEWSETESVPQTVATIQIDQIEKQDIKGLKETCENMAFTAWHALPEHQPVGSVNKLRGFVYDWMSEYRRVTLNGLTPVEPTE